MRLFLTFRAIAGFSVALAGLASCTNKKDAIGPAAEPCATTATVRLCPGFTAICPTQHTTLILADGTRLRPSGPVWDSYQPEQADGQVLRISYKIVPGLTMQPELPGYEDATLSCLEIQQVLCGTR